MTTHDHRVFVKDCFRCDLSRNELARFILDVPPPKGAACHCGRPVAYGFDGDPTHHRGMCDHCDAIRCDAYPGECER